MTEAVGGDNAIGPAGGTERPGIAPVLDRLVDAGGHERATEWRLQRGDEQTVVAPRRGPGQDRKDAACRGRQVIG